MCGKFICAAEHASKDANSIYIVTCVLSTRQVPQLRPHLSPPLLNANSVKAKNSFRFRVLRGRFGIGVCFCSRRCGFIIISRRRRVFIAAVKKSLVPRAKNGLKLWGEFIKAISASLSIQRQRSIKNACLNYLEALVV